MFSLRTMRTILRASLAIGAVMTPGAVDAQTVNWVEMGSPSARCCMGMAYDGATHSTVLFGGVEPSPRHSMATPGSGLEDGSICRPPLRPPRAMVLLWRLTGRRAT